MDQSGQSGNRLPPLRIPRSVAEEHFPEAMGAPSFEVEYGTAEEAFKTQQQVRDAQLAEERRRLAAAEQARRAPAPAPEEGKRSRGKLLAVGATVLAFLTPSMVVQYQDHDKHTALSTLSDAFMGTILFVPNYIELGGKLGEIGDNIFGDNTPNNAKAAPVASASPKPSKSASPSASPKPSPSPSPSKTEAMDTLPIAKNIASIQTPQKQPFTFKYSKDKDGDILGYNGYYKAGAGMTAKEVQWIESCGNTTDTVLLGFDDTGSPQHIRAIAKVLKQNKVGGVFFLNTSSSPDGGKTSTSKELIDELRSDGFYVGNHSATHPDMTKLKDAEIRAELVEGGPANLVRLPYGATKKDKNGKIYVDDRVLSVAKETGAAVCGWTGDTRDWSKDATTASMVKAVKENLRPGANFLMHVHDNDPTLKALPEIIKVTKEKGLNLCPIATKPTTADFSETKICAS